MMAELEMLEKYFGTMPQAFSLLEVLVNEREEPYDFRFIYLNEAAAKLNCMAGPCAVESREQLFEAADLVKKAGAQFLRGGAYKPRTSPYSFQGLEETGLRYLAEARERTGLKIVTEVTEVEAVETVAKYADMLQIGARNMQNFRLLKEVGRTDKPVLLKRGLAATLNEWLNAAEYIMNGHLTKPVEPAVLYRAIQEALEADSD